MQLSFGVKTSQSGIGYEEIVALWREADANPTFGDAWVWDHMVPLRGDVRGDALEAWTLLAALAVQTERLRLGVIVTSNRLRSPALLAKMAATVDVISGGRLVFGIGAGGSRIAGPQLDDDARRRYDESVAREYGAYGVSIVPVAEAISDLDETCAIATRMWTETEPFDFDGRRHRLRGAVCEPKPIQRPHPPIMIGAGGERLSLGVVARHADIWNCPARSADELRRKSAVLDRRCAEIGRDPAEIVRSVQVLVERSDPLAAREQILAMTAEGASHIVLAPLPPWPPRPARWLQEEIVEPVRAAASRPV